MTEWNMENDRRQCFRIEDQASVRFRVLEPDQTGPADSLFPPPPLFNLLTDLRTLDEEAEFQLRKVAETDRATASCLRMLNRKIDRIARALAQPTSDQHHCQITLSEGGLSLIATHSIGVGQKIALQLQLLPEGTGLTLTAEVVYALALTDPQHENLFRIGCRFIDPEDADRHAIARHIFETQARQRRLEREQQQRQAESVPSEDSRP